MLALVLAVAASGTERRLFLPPSPPPALRALGRVKGAPARPALVWHVDAFRGAGSERRAELEARPEPPSLPVPSFAPSLEPLEPRTGYSFQAALALLAAAGLGAAAAQRRANAAGTPGNALKGMVPAQNAGALALAAPAAVAIAPMAPMPIEVPFGPAMSFAEGVALQPAEVVVFGVLSRTVARARRTQAGRALVVRVAGGWVRDRLLGKVSSDLDIAVEGLSGVELAELVQAYCVPLDHVEVSYVGTPFKKVEQSKHLETACIRVSTAHGDVSLDFCELRNEVYTHDSRIPIVTAATAQEDAARRDFTINGLFYNPQTRQIEDFVGGLADLQRGLLRTPRPAAKTFADDPLRVLRGVRFAAAYELRLDAAARAAALQIAGQGLPRVSRERVGHEVMKMLSSGLDTGYRALRLLADLNLMEDVFGELEERPRVWSVRGIKACAKLRSYGRTAGLETDEAARNALLAALLEPFADGPRGVEEQLACTLRLGKAESRAVGRVLKGARMLRNNADPSAAQLQLGRMIFEVKESWITAVRVAQALGWAAAGTVEAAEDAGLGKCWAWTPAVGGELLRESYGFAPGPLVGRVIKAQIDWRIQHPRADEAAQLAALEGILEEQGLGC